MNERRRLTPEERDAAGSEARASNPDKQVFVQEWTNAAGEPIVVTIQAP